MTGGDFGARAPLDFDGEVWYANPLCGSSCGVEPWWENAEGSEIVGVGTSDVLLGFVLRNEVNKEGGGVEGGGWTQVLNVIFSLDKWNEGRRG